jgi:hypothetical protein
MKPTLQERLAKYLKARPGERIAKGLLEDLARQHMGYTAETVGRRLRVLHEATCVAEASTKTSEHDSAFRLAEGGKFLVEHRDKNHCFYWYEPAQSRVVREVKVVDGVAREVYTTVTA